eukprot:Colp12_sorted_trinity150504_noHs@21034
MNAAESEYERERLRRIQENQRILASLELDEAKDQLHVITHPTAKRKPEAGKKPPPKRQKVILPQRQSLRLRGVTPEGKSIPTPEEEPAPVDQRKPGPLKLAEIAALDEDVKFDEAAFKALWSSMKSPKSTSGKQSGVENVAKMRLTEASVVKVVPERIFTVAYHPCTTKSFLGIGDKEGRLALWDVEKGENGVHSFDIFNRPVSCVTFSEYDEAKVIASSYDGSVRRLDLSHHTFEDLYTDELEYLCTGVAMAHHSRTCYISNEAGQLAMADIRSGPQAQGLYDLHERKIATLHFNPTDSNFLVTASNDGTACIWDVRHLSKKKNNPVVSLQHGKAVTSARFSPDGLKMITNSNDNTIRLWHDIIEKGADAHCKIIKHDNETGRWITRFRVDWLPGSDGFMSGNMKRGVDIYGADKGEYVAFLSSEHLTAIPSLNAAHVRNGKLEIASATASGRVCVWH